MIYCPKCYSEAEPFTSDVDGSTEYVCADHGKVAGDRADFLPQDARRLAEILRTVALDGAEGQDRELVLMLIRALDV